MNLAKDSSTTIDFQPMTVHLHWEQTTDLDILAVYEDAEQCRKLVYFAESGSRVEYPFIELLFDFEFSEIPKDHQEIIAIESMEVEKIYFYAWDFDAVQEAEPTDFSEQGVFLEFRMKDTNILSSAADLGKGNLAFLASIEKKGNQICIQNHSEMKEVSLPEQMEDLLKQLFE